MNQSPPLPAEASAKAGHQPPKKRRSVRRKILFGSLIAIGGTVVLLVVVAAFFSRQVTKRVLTQVGKNLKTELKMADADLSLLRYFPDATVTFQNVRAKDFFGKELLRAGEVSFRFSLMSLFGSTIEVRSVVLRDGVLRINYDRQGRPNYDIFKETSRKPTADNAAIDLSLAEWHDLLVDYSDEQSRQSARFLVKNATFAGNFSAKRFNLDTRADFTSQFVDLDGDRFLVEQPMGWDAAVAVDLQKNAWVLKKTELSVGDNVLSLDGAVVREADAANMNLRFSSKEGDVSILFSLLPASLASYFKDFSSTGKYTFAGFVHGKNKPGRRPNCAVDFSLRDGEITSSKLYKPLEKVSFKARVETAPGEPGRFSVENFAASFDGEPISLRLEVTDFDDPEVDFSCSGALPLEAGFGLFDEPKITEGSGRIVCKSLIVTGKYKNMTSMSGIAAVQTGGVVEFDKAAVKFNGAWIEAPRGRVRLAGDILSLDTIELKIKSSDLAFSGEFHHFLPAIFADSANTEKAATQFFANLTSQNLDVDELLAINSVEQNVRSGSIEKWQADSFKTEKNLTRQRLTDLLVGTFEARIANLNYKKIDAKNFTGQLGFNHNDLRIAGDVEAMRGSLHLEGNAFFEEKPRLKARITCKNLDLQEALRQCDNFGQETILDKNLRGRLDGRVAVNAFWTADGDFDMKKLRVLADLNGRDGELVDLPMLRDFSKFIHVEDLERVKFTQMQNFIEVRDRTVFIPVMFLQSNACNLTVSGKQDFDDNMDYNFKVNAGQVLLNKVKKHDKSLDPLPEKNGLFNLYYSMCCKLENYEVRRDKRGVKEAFEKSEARRKIIAAALEAEFRGIDVAMPTTYNFQAAAVKTGAGD